MGAAQTLPELKRIKKIKEGKHLCMTDDQSIMQIFNQNNLWSIRAENLFKR